MFRISIFKCLDTRMCGATRKLIVTEISRLERKHENLKGEKLTFEWLSIQNGNLIVGYIMHIAQAKSTTEYNIIYSLYTGKVTQQKE